MFSIEIDSNSRYKVIRKLTSLNNKIKVPIKTGLTGMAQDVENLANENLRTSLDPGSQSLPRPEQSIFNNWKTDEPVKYEQGDYVKYLYNNSDHACVVGSKSSVSLNDKDQKEICCINPGDKVLTKDGTSHRVLATKSDLSVKDRPNLVIFNTEKSYKQDGTILTTDHLVLAWNISKGYAYWEEIGNLNEGDYIMRKIKIPWNKGTRKTKICKHCGVKFKIDKNIRKYCSQECYHSDVDHNYTEGMRWTLSKEICDKKRGKNNPAYIDGRNARGYGYGWIDNLRNNVKKRDNYTCQNCGVMDDLVVHHIDSDKHHNVMENLVTLCRSCHVIRHWRERDCELVGIDMSTFKPVRITELRHVTGRELFPQNNAKLYDLNVEHENSFVVNGILVHNSAVEFGTMDGGRGYIEPVHASGLKIEFADGRVERYPYVRGQPPKLYTTTAMATYADKSIDVFKGMFSEALSMISVSK